MNIGQIIRFHSERFFEGAVQLSWLQRRADLARQAATAFVFHGPRYHGAAQAEQDGIEGGYKLKDTASFVRDLLNSMNATATGHEANPFWLVVAGYGSGKSHLALTLAHLLEKPDDETAQAILEQIHRTDATIGETIRQHLTTEPKPALVLPLDGTAGFHLGNALSRVVFERLRHHGVDATPIRELSPRFRTAEQFVERNYAVRVDGFQQRLPGLDATRIAERLREHDEEVYAAVDILYQEANGHPIPVEGQESAQELIDTLRRVYCGPGGPFSHVLILFDELGRYLEYASEKPTLAGDFALQQIFQGVQDNSARVRFIGFIQYELKAYLKRFSGADLRQLQRYVTRFDAAEKWYLSTNLETIFAHMIGKDEASLQQLWQRTDAEHQVQRTWQYLSASLPGFSRFPVWSDQERFSRVIAHGCWPLHPLAVWFLTRLRDLVQSRSAMTFIKDVMERVSVEAADNNGRIRQVSAAELVIGNMLPELVSAERETGGSVAETLQMLLEKFSGHLDRHQRLVLAGVAVIEKTRIGKQSRAMADALLGEATALPETVLPELLETLAELGAMEWNEDLGQYELLTDGATRGQFRQWLRTQQAGLDASAVRDLFLRRGAADVEGLGVVAPDFARSRDIATPEWYFEIQLANVHSVEAAICKAFQEWSVASQPKDARGKLIYLYLHPDDDLAGVDTMIQARMRAELAALGQAQAPIWVISLEDRKGGIAEHLSRLYLFDEKINAADTERYRRFIPDERERSRIALRDEARQSIKAQRQWVAGFAETLSGGRLRQTGLEIFSQIYPRTVPFPFDGFASTSGGGAVDVANLIRVLVPRQFNAVWLQGQPRKLHNRVDAVLIQSWQAMLPSGKLRLPAEPALNSLCQWLESAHRDDPDRTLLASYRTLIAPPYGMNASSAGLLLGLFLGLETPPRRLLISDKPVSATEWLSAVFPASRNRNFLDEGILAKTKVRFLAEDSEGRWRALLQRWEVEQDYDALMKLSAEAERMLASEPVPETMEGNLNYFREKSVRARDAILLLSQQLSEWERGIERIVSRSEVEHAIRLSSIMLRQRAEMVDNPCWPAHYLQSLDTLLGLVRGLIDREIAGWIPRQLCHNATQVGDFRKRTERDAETLEKLGYRHEAQTLIQQAQQSIHRVEKLQKHALTLSQAEDYPRQPTPAESTPVRDLRDQISQGDELIVNLEAAGGALSPQTLAAHVQAIKNRQAKLQAVVKRHQEGFGALYELTVDSKEALLEAITRVNRLRAIFVETRDEQEVRDMAVQLEAILADISAWNEGDVSVERLEELLGEQVEQQVEALENFLEEKEIDPAWTLGIIYRALMDERLAVARRRSAEWVKPRLVLAEKIGSLDRQGCLALIKELEAIPAYLATEDASSVENLLNEVRVRLHELEEQDRQAKISTWRRPFSTLDRVEQFDRQTVEKLLQDLRRPPCELRPDEKAQLTVVEVCLTTRLDQISMDELFDRIERLSSAQRRELLLRLAALCEGENPATGLV